MIGKYKAFEGGGSTQNEIWSEFACGTLQVGSRKHIKNYVIKSEFEHPESL